MQVQSISNLQFTSRKSRQIKLLHEFSKRSFDMPTGTKRNTKVKVADYFPFGYKTGKIANVTGNTAPKKVQPSYYPFGGNVGNINRDSETLDYITESSYINTVK